MVGTQRRGLRRRVPSPRVKVCVVAEFYPSERDPVLGVWAHRQALAARDAGADVQVLVLHRLVPPEASLRDGAWRRGVGARGGGARGQGGGGGAGRAGPFVSPPRPRAHPEWG